MSLFSLINHHSPNKLFRIKGSPFLCIAILCAFASCVSVPKAALDISVQLEQQLYTLQQATHKYCGESISGKREVYR